MTISRTETAVFSALMRVRPSQVAEFLKTTLRIRRRIVDLDVDGRIRLWVDPVSVFGQSVINEGVYERSMTKLVGGLSEPGATVVDIGTSEGYFTTLAA